MRSSVCRRPSALLAGRSRALIVVLGAALVASLLVTSSRPAGAADCPGPGGGSLPSLGAESLDPDMVTFRGRGWGHAVGMSQHGAQGAALLGCTATDILKAYYRNTATEGWDTAKRIRVSLDASARATDVSAKADAIGWKRCESSSDTSCPHIDTQPAGTTWRVRTTKDGLLIKRHGDLDDIHVTGVPQVRVLLNGKVAEISTIRVRDGSEVTTSSRRYKYGYFEFHRRWARAAFATVDLPLERYLYGIDEIPFGWEPAALRAQAISARTYGLRRVNAGTSSSCRCHVSATTASQVYNGYETEEKWGFANWKSAVDDTFGKVVVYEGALADTVYSSSSGGYTASSEFVWGTNHGYLQPFDDSRWEQESGNSLSAWSATVSRGWLGSKLNIGQVTRAFVADPTGPGSPRRVGDPAKGYGGVTFTGTTTGPSAYPGCSTPSQHTTTCSGDTVRSLLQSAGHRVSTMFTVDYRYRQVPWDSVVFGDFDGNGSDEMLLYHRTSGETLVHAVDQAGRPGTVINRYWLAKGWDEIIAGDYDGDGDDELSFYRSSTGAFATYSGQSNGGLGRRLYKAEFRVGWTGIFSGDHNGDGSDQLTFYRSQSGRYASYRVNADSSLGQRTYRANLLKGWSAVFAGDFNANGRDQVTFYRESDGRFASYVTKTDGSLRRRTYRANLLTGWTSVEAGEHGRSDGDLVSFYRTSDGRIAAYATTSEGGLRTRTHRGTL